MAQHLAYVARYSDVVKYSVYVALHLDVTSHYAFVVKHFAYVASHLEYVVWYLLNVASSSAYAELRLVDVGPRYAYVVPHSSCAEYVAYVVPHSTYDEQRLVYVVWSLACVPHSACELSSAYVELAAYVAPSLAYSVGVRFPSPVS